MRRRTCGVKASHWFKRTQIPQASLVMAHEEGPKGMFGDEKTFKKYLYEMYEMVKFIYEERNSRLQG